MVWTAFSARCRACKHQTGVGGTGHEMKRARTQERGGRGYLEARSSPWWCSPEEAGALHCLETLRFIFRWNILVHFVLCDSSSVNIFLVLFLVTFVTLY